MFFVLFLVFSLISHLFASDRSNRQVPVVYEEEKWIILFRAQCHLKLDEQIRDEFDSKFNESVTRLHRRFDLKKFMESMIAEKSNQFLITFWFGFGALGKLLVFPTIISLYPFRDSKSIKLKKIMKNFRIFIHWKFNEMNDPNCCTGSADPSERRVLLDLVQNFWQQRFEHLCSKILSSDEFMKQKKLVEERIRFTYKFLDCGAKYLLMGEFKNLRNDLQGKNYKDSQSAWNFAFLVRHFERHLEKVQSSNFVELFDWLASQSPLFIIYFFYFAKHSYLECTSHLDLLIHGEIEEIRTSVSEYIELEGKKLSIFAYLIDGDYEEDERISSLAYRILEKTGIIKRTAELVQVNSI
jgi:hypothetical protein